MHIYVWSGVTSQKSLDNNFEGNTDNPKVFNLFIKVIFQWGLIECACTVGISDEEKIGTAGGACLLDLIWSFNIFL